MASRVQLDTPAYFPSASRPRFALAAWLRSAVTRWRERRILETLDERTLRDIGISRSQALAEARKPCWRR